jgi:hypothetical protein
MEQISEGELGMLSLRYFMRIAKEMLPSRMVVMGASIFDVNVEKPMEN